MTIPEINERIKHLPGQILFDLARNQSANHYWRKAAVELLIDNHYPQAKHDELLSLVFEVEAERRAKAEVESVVETAIEAPVSRFDEPVDPSALKASFTTASQTQEEVIQN